MCGKTATNFLLAKVSIIFCSGKIIADKKYKQQ